MTRTRILLCLLALCSLSAPAHATLAEITSATSVTGEGGYSSAIIDDTGGFAYFGSSPTFAVSFTTFSVVTPVMLSPFTVKPHSGSFLFLNTFTAAAFDSGTRYGYFISSGIPSAIELVPLGTSVALSSITLSAGQNSVGTAVIDSTNHFAYLGTGTSPSMVVKIKLPDGKNVTSMSIVSALSMPVGLENLSASVIDTAHGFAYFGSSTTTGAVAKIKLADFSLAGTLTFNSGEGAVGSAVIDTTRQHILFGTHDNPGKIVEVLLSNFTRSNGLTLKIGENDVTSAVIDPTHNAAYFGTNTSSGIVIPISLSNFNEGPSLKLGAGDNDLRSAVVDLTNRYAFFGTFTTPGRIVQVDLIAGPPTILVQPTNANIHPGEMASFFVSADGRNISYQWQMNGVDIPGATSSSYSKTALVTDDGTQFNCVVTNSQGAVTTSTVQIVIIPIVRAFPNPWRADRHAGVNITFDGLLANSTVKIFNLAAHWVKTLPPASGSTTWDRTNDQGQTVASGYYFYLVEGRTDKQTVQGKLAIIR